MANKRMPRGDHHDGRIECSSKSQLPGASSSPGQRFLHESLPNTQSWPPQTETMATKSEHKTTGNLPKCRTAPPMGSSYATRGNFRVIVLHLWNKGVLALPFSASSDATVLDSILLFCSISSACCFSNTSSIAGKITFAHAS